MAKSAKSRIREIEPEEFKAFMRAKVIRPASLEDVYGTHHRRTLYRHPNTGQFWVEIQKEAVS